MALISTLHKWLGDTDGTGSTIRVLLCDYPKLFDLIDHSLLVTKLKQVDIPRSIIKCMGCKFSYLQITKRQTGTGLFFGVERGPLRCYPGN